MLRFFKSLFGKSTQSEPQAPYKVEAPVAEPTPAPQPAKCGCGRSPSGFCVGLHKLSDAEWAVHADNPAKQAEPAKPAAKKAPAKKKPAAMKAPAKPKAPRKPKAK